jgi:ketosteroid isomerase-like protein
MSQENVELVRKVVEAFNRRDVATLSAMHDPGVQWAPREAQALERSVYRGHEGIAQYFEDLASVWDEMSFEPEEFRDSGNHVVTGGRLRARGRGSGADIDEHVGVVHEIRNGKVVRAETYPTWTAALEAAGLRE